MSPQPFLVVGSMKSGTTTLDTLLRAHPDVDVVTEKETLSFADPARAHATGRAIRSSAGRAAGEVSTGYMQRPLVHCDPALAHEILGPDLRVIAVLRDPVDRALSHWRHWEQLGRNGPGEMADLLLDPEGPYVAFSSYHRQILPWVDAVGVPNVLLLRLEDYNGDPTAWLQRVADTLGIPPFDTEGALHANQGDTRVVTAGIGRRVSRSSVYQRMLRPFVPSSARRLAARTMGGRRGGARLPPIPETLRAEFREVIASDVAALGATWPLVTWPASGARP